MSSFLCITITYCRSLDNRNMNSIIATFSNRDSINFVIIVYFLVYVSKLMMDLCLPNLLDIILTD